jgi:RimJ/RimL family protein N-acetyltransferase
VIPQLQTERLLLRGFTQEDFEDYARFHADPEVMRYISGSPASRTEAWRSFAVMIGHWALRGYGMWGVERKSDGALVGRVGLWNPEGWPGLEVGWTLGREFWGQGYATEAARTAMDFAFITQDIARLLSVIDVGNQPSQRVAERLGETRGDQRMIEFAGKTFTADIWSISREDWTRRN